MGCCIRCGGVWEIFGYFCWVEGFDLQRSGFERAFGFFDSVFFGWTEGRFVRWEGYVDGKFGLDFVVFQKMFSKLLVLILQSVSKQTSFRSDGEKPVVVQFLVRPSKSLENLSFQNFVAILVWYSFGARENSILCRDDVVRHTRNIWGRPHAEGELS